MLKLTIPGEPASKKNSQQIIRVGGKPVPLPSKKYREYLERCRAVLPHRRLPIAVPVNLKCTFYRSERRRVDLVNLEEAVCDALTDCGILLDDNRDIVAGMDGSRVLYDKANPRTEIEITELAEYSQWRSYDA